MWDAMASSRAVQPGKPTGARDLSLKELSALSDDDLMASLKAGRNDALTILFERYNRLVLSIALKILRDPAEAEDVMQVVFLEIFRAMAQFDPAKSTTKVWILQYAYHRAIDRRQHLNARNFYNSTGIEAVETEFSGTTLTHASFNGGEIKRLVQQGLATLNSSQKRVIELASYSGYSMREIADKTGDSFENVRHHYYRGLKKLRSFITENRK
jgi:RNA polymerase sigma-70 factor (ECF subfamily)